MNCERSQELVQRYLDGEAEAVKSPEARRHFAECAVCRSAMSAARVLLRGVGLLPKATPSDGLVGQVVSQVAREGRPVVLRFSSWATAAAAMIVLAVGVWAYRNLNQPPGEPQGRGGLVEKADKPSDPPLRIEELGGTTLALTRNALAETASSAGILVPPLETFPASLPVRVAPPSLPLGEVGDTFAMGLSPVTESASRAWNMLVSGLPSE